MEILALKCQVYRLCLDAGNQSWPAEPRNLCFLHALVYTRLTIERTCIGTGFGMGASTLSELRASCSHRQHSTPAVKGHLINLAMPVLCARPG
jgi:hypothetical protein